ncbi:TIGR03546 family protein [Aestuariibacter sp. AA17]|uniref:TIGR03546 family protein n=1 Tax=Fluctibacter corallii TaxID=2984329 RepID=A0ABT3A7G3_9ALTE|nr:TIGR03546 family protein [Aestuariibacter sp. AA17]MCV2884624.1 TIGR03546 family protein [Aestuariibacter sp. AA17]
MYWLAKFFKILHSASSPWQIAFAIALGMILGLTPLLRLHNLVVVLCILFFRVNLTAALVSWGAFTLIAYLFDPLMIAVGEALLTAPSLHSVWQSAYNSSIGVLSQFNHTLTLGSLVVAMVLFPIVVITSKILVVKYRERVMEWIKTLKIVEFIKGTRIYSLYEKMES